MSKEQDERDTRIMLRMNPDTDSDKAILRILDKIPNGRKSAFIKKAILATSKTTKVKELQND